MYAWWRHIPKDTTAIPTPIGPKNRLATPEKVVVNAAIDQELAPEKAKAYNASAPNAAKAQLTKSAPDKPGSPTLAPISSPLVTTKSGEKLL